MKLISFTNQSDQYTFIDNYNLQLISTI